jgi:hypothetical protein
LYLSSQARVVALTVTTPLPLASLIMAPRGHNPSRPPITQPSRIEKAIIDAVELYEEIVPEADKVKMVQLEEEVRVTRQFQDDEDVEALLGGLIPDLGCTQSRNSKFFQTLELYWHTKTLVALGMLPKEQDFHQLKRRHEALEIQCAYVAEVVTWLANRQGGNFTPPAVNYVEADSSQAVVDCGIVDLTSQHHIK